MNTRTSTTQRMSLTALALAAIFGSAGCANMSDRDKSTAVGAAAGGVAGSVLSGGSTTGTVGGAVIGGVIGNQTGKKKGD